MLATLFGTWYAAPTTISTHAPPSIPPPHEQHEDAPSSSEIRAHANRQRGASWVPRKVRYERVKKGRATLRARAEAEDAEAARARAAHVAVKRERQALRRRQKRAAKADEERQEALRKRAKL